MKILITGGAGYIGSHVVKFLGESCKYEITVVDNLSTGYEDSVLYGDFVKKDLEDFDSVDRLFAEKNFDAVIHLAAATVVPESVENPLKYYMNNTVNTAYLIKMCLKYSVKRFVFSSTAAVYGEPEEKEVSEKSELSPVNPYGMSKLMSERMIKDAGKAHSDFSYIILRYFNVAGADSSGKIGQRFPEATHLIKVACQTALGIRDRLEMFGTDFPTKDGTGVRDYIHVNDIAQAHLAVLEKLEKGGKSDIFNCGYRRGFSVKDIVETVKKVSYTDFKVVKTERRAGDPSCLIADNSKILRLTKWSPGFDDIETICRSAFLWEKKLSRKKTHNFQDS
ncbi:MAG: UDP-glucose 4-epimerase GalE [bacterium]